MKFLFTIFFIATKILYGQTDRDNYRIKIGKYSFRPFFIQDGKPGVKWAPGDDGDLMPYVANYPKRSDTVDSFDAYGKPEKEIFTTWQYSIDLFVDSISKNYFDTLIKQAVLLTYKNKLRQVYSLTFQIMYADGKRLSKTINSNKISDASSLLIKKFPYRYLVISNIRFYGDENKKLQIDDVIGWKIKDD